ncbi:MAG: amidohydrolase [Steroidobacteraceae bacterium]
MKTWLCASAALLVVVGCARDSKPAAMQPADLLLINGAIYTVDPQHPWAEAIAVDDGRIVFVGDSKTARQYAGEHTEVVDLGGGFVMPGIVDMHVHPIMGGLKSLYECSFPFSAGPDEIKATLRGCVAKASPGQWIRGGQWGSSFFEQYAIPSPRRFLDEISGDHPVYLYDDSGHNAWVNSKALSAAGLDQPKPDPEGGKIVRERDGAANGVLLETAARVYDKVVPPWSDEQVLAAAKESSRLANAYGITAIKDAGAPFDTSAAAFSSLDKAGELTLNVAVCARTPYGSRTEPLDYADIEKQRQSYRTKHVHTDFVKIFLDGVPTPARTAAMLAPYLPDEAHGDKFTGELHVDPALLARDVTELDKRGFTIKMHAAGDRSIRVGLDAVAAARKANGPSGLHHELAHAGYIDDTDIARFAELDVVADYSPIIWYPSPIIDAVISAVGERGQHYWPTRSLLAAGASVAAGSDWPAAVPDENPWVGIEALVTRRDPRGSSERTLWPEQAVSLEDAIRIYTLNGARALRLETETGSIAVGKSADIIVLDQNLFKVPIEQVGDTKPLRTYFEGRLVFDATGM